MNPADVFAQFVNAINRHHVGAITALMTPEHGFIDSLGNRVHGAKTMEAGWRGYFNMCPDYAIRIDQALADHTTVVACGEAGGTIDGIPWRTPAAWRALVHNGKIAEFQVFADNKPVYEILAKRSRSS
ncbi:MAG TPA: nuclear transport factor 2 family protein [Bryobacteraceae bacterium]|nr:nuclear transport factor 2 family protein [Bryobacteraceae bacterium]